MNKNLLIKIGLSMMTTSGLALVGISHYAVKQWRKADRQLKEANFMLGIHQLGITCKDIEIRHLNEELKELKAKRK